MEMQTLRGIVSQGESSTLFHKELDTLSDADRQKLLTEAGIVNTMVQVKRWLLKLALDCLGQNYECFEGNIVYDKHMIKSVHYWITGNTTTGCLF